METPARPTYASAPGPNGLRRVIRSDGLPLGTAWPALSAAAAAPAARAEALLGLDLDLAAALARRPDLRRLRRRLNARKPVACAVTGAELVRRRQLLGLSQRELAAQACVSRSMLAALETGDRHNGRVLPEVVRALAWLEGGQTR